VGVTLAFIILLCKLCGCYSCIFSGAIFLITFFLLYLYLRIPYNKYKIKYIREICKAELLTSKDIADELDNRIKKIIYDVIKEKKTKGNTNVIGQ